MKALATEIQKIQDCLESDNYKSMQALIKTYREYNQKEICEIATEIRLNECKESLIACLIEIKQWFIHSDEVLGLFDNDSDSVTSSQYATVESNNETEIDNTVEIVTEQLSISNPVNGRHSTVYNSGQSCNALFSASEWAELQSKFWSNFIPTKKPYRTFNNDRVLDTKSVYWVNT